MHFIENQIQNKFYNMFLHNSLLRSMEEIYNNQKFDGFIIRPPTVPN